MTTYSRGDVVNVPVTFTNQSGSKARPALVVSVRSYNHTTPDVLIMSITGNLPGLSHPGDYVIQDWQQAGLLKPSKVQTKLATVESSIIRGKRGQLTARDLAGAEAGLRIALGL
jgi:mRNA interferase MazF